MTNYNDGKWHGWNGGECPVHPKSEVECGYADKRGKLGGIANSFPWDGLIFEHGATDRPIAFRVVKEHREPIEWWLTNGRVFSNAREAKTAYPGCDPVHVREVLE